MNKTINELWWKARIGYNNQSCDNEVIEKFANLIVQECVEICRKGINNATDWDSSYWDQACENRAETIQQHFGVTE